MNELVKLIIELQGIVGALLGVISTLVVTEIVKNKGKIKFYLQKSDFKMYMTDSYGGQTETNLYDDVESSTIAIEMDIFNSSYTPRPLREIRVKFYDSEGKLLLETKAFDESTRRVSAGMVRSDIIEIINVGAKEMLHIKISSPLGKEDSKLIYDFDSASFEAKDHKGKKHKQLIMDKRNNGLAYWMERSYVADYNR